MDSCATASKHLFWTVLLLAGLALFGAAPSQAAAAGMGSMPGMAMPGTDRQMAASHGMPASCPMKGALPCCRGKGSGAVCPASVCDLCLLTAQMPGLSPLRAVPVAPPALRVLAGAGPRPPDLPAMLFRFAFHMPSRSVSARVNPPLLI